MAAGPIVVFTLVSVWNNQWYMFHWQLGLPVLVSGPRLDSGRQHEEGCGMGTMGTGVLDGRNPDDVWPDPAVLLTRRPGFHAADFYG